MNTKQHLIHHGVSSQTPAAPAQETSPAKEIYRAPQVKIHGKLERMTLQDNSPGGGGGGGGGTGNTAEE